ncbi:MAG: phosphatidylglycerophosphatase A, partial [Gammaproteobacteria bacterium]
AIPIYLLLKDVSLIVYVITVLLVIVIGIYACFYTSQALKVHDHPAIVVDEIAGFLITMIAVPFTWYWLLTGFVLFRLFDILKPWPISWLDQHVHGGTGIMLDDILAGLAALGLLHIMIWVV